MTKKRKKRKRKLSKIAVLLGICIILLVCCISGLVFLACSSNRNDKVVIALDAGHDNSNLGYSGIITEYEYTSKMVDKLNTLFKEDNHFEVILTHNTDEDMPLGKRVEAIKKADLVLTIHASYSGDASLSGTHIIAKPVNKKGHDESKEIASLIGEKLENSTVCYAYYEPVKENEYAIKYVDINDETEYDYETMEFMEATDIPVVQLEGIYVSSQSDVDTYMSDESMDSVAKNIYAAIRSAYVKE